MNGFCDHCQHPLEFHANGGPCRLMVSADPGSGDSFKQCPCTGAVREKDPLIAPIRIDSLFGGVIAAVAQAIGTDETRRYLESCLADDVFWEAMRLIHARGYEDAFGHAVREIGNEAKVNLAISSATRRKGGS